MFSYIEFILSRSDFMTEIAVLGYGTVGSGVYEVLNTNRESIDKNADEEIRIKYVLDLRDFPDDSVQKFIVHDFNIILNDDNIKVIAEVMGGIEPAYTFVKSALLKGKSVVTSNKELVAKHGAELLKIAGENNINFLFEASVGGGIPIIRPLNQSLTADKIYEITGILNGTTNYMLTKMTKDGLEYDEILKDAQNKGYAERNPAADVEGFDACRKIAILLSLAAGKQADFEDIYTEGITNISKTDIDYAKKMNKSIKLLAVSKITDKGVWARVSPVIIGEDNPLSMVNDVFNAIMIKGNVIGDVMFYGKGAGKLPTASAVVADIVDAVKNLNKNIMTAWSPEKLDIINIDDVETNKFIRVEYNNKEKAISSVKEIFGNCEIIDAGQDIPEFAFISENAAEKSINDKINDLLNKECVVNIPNTIRIEK